MARQPVQDGTTHPGDVVPIMADNSLWAIVAMLAVWKAGCAWTMLDISHPDAWVNQILEYGQVMVVVCNTELEHQLPK